MAIKFNIEIKDWNGRGENAIAEMRIAESSDDDLAFTQTLPATEIYPKTVSTIIIPRSYVRAVIEQLEAASVLDIRD